MNSRWHLMVSVLKSGIRILGCLYFAFTEDIMVFVYCFFFAEVLGISEELGDKR